MNKQAKKLKNGEIGRGIEWTTYTWNPVRGCKHACQWTMPDGAIANCYAEDVAGKFRTAYPDGFEHHYWHPELLGEPARVKTPSKIFVGSMADVFGHWVPFEQIEQIFDACQDAPQHTFQFLTKNPKRVVELASCRRIPANCWIGASSPPDFMWNKPLSLAQKERMLDVTLDALAALKIVGVTTWMSAEPLSWDISTALAMSAAVINRYRGTVELPIDWIVIGAASNGPKHYAPNEDDVRRLLVVLDRYHIPRFYKGNLDSLPLAISDWREEFPAVS